MVSLLFALTLGAPFSDGAVVQRGCSVPVWGTADVGHSVSVSFAGQEKTVRVDEDGTWRVNLDPLAPSCEGRTLSVSERSRGFFIDSTIAKIAVKDVLVGEVWLASGQSNMECPLWSGSPRYRDGKGALMMAMTRLPLVRYVKVPKLWSPSPREQRAKWCAFVAGEFAPAENGSTEYPSALAFYYARELYLALGIPIGIVDASWGGTNIDAWTPRSGYEDCEEKIRATADYVEKDEPSWKTEGEHVHPISALQQQPTVLWNGMVAAFAPMAVRGCIWYQGCHNSGEGDCYRAKMHALYNGWAREFANPNLKFYFVELAPYADSWLDICSAQEKFADEQPNSAMAVTSDVGNFDDIHPNDKEIVAKRLAVHALKRDYGFDISEDCSPVFRSVEFKDGKAVMSFDHVKSWYVYARDRSHDAPFEVAGTNGVWEAAKILNFRHWTEKDGKTYYTDDLDGPRIVVASEKVKEPTRVRYMVRPRSAGTLYNEVDLPLGVFESR